MDPQTFVTAQSVSPFTSNAPSCVTLDSTENRTLALTQFTLRLLQFSVQKVVGERHNSCGSSAQVNLCDHHYGQILEKARPRPFLVAWHTFELGFLLTYTPFPGNHFSYG